MDYDDDNFGFELLDLLSKVRAALKELGVPGPDTPAPVANAIGILTRALNNA
jgi:hypothetical protein